MPKNLERKGLDTLHQYFSKQANVRGQKNRFFGKQKVEPIFGDEESVDMLKEYEERVKDLKKRNAIPVCDVTTRKFVFCTNATMKYKSDKTIAEMQRRVVIAKDWFLRLYSQASQSNFPEGEIIGDAYFAWASELSKNFSAENCGILHRACEQVALLNEVTVSQNTITIVDEFFTVGDMTSDDRYNRPKIFQFLNNMLSRKHDPVEVYILIIRRMQEAEEHRLDIFSSGDETVKQLQFRTIVTFGKVIWKDEILRTFLEGSRDIDWTGESETTWRTFRRFLVKLCLHFP